MQNPKIKICGVTTMDDIQIVNNLRADLIGFVLFFSKSKRNIELETASYLKDNLNKGIKTVAVTVSPTKEQMEAIKEAGFDFIQIHGELDEIAVKQSDIKVFRAFHISKNATITKENKNDNIIGYVLDGEKPGNGEVFDWNLMRDFNTDGKLLMLAGGLHADNVKEAIKQMNPDIVDVSSGVEKENGLGKSKEKVEAFIKAVRGQEP